MSAVLEAFKSNARGKNWPEAMKQCNGLNMTEMLEGLDSLGPKLLDEFDSQLATAGFPYGVERMKWAVEVVRTRKIPAGAAPGDLLKTGQVQDAKNFLAKAKTFPKLKRKRLKLTLFWTQGALSETVSSALVQKAQDLLQSNGDQFVLDIDSRRTSLPFDKTVDFEIDGCEDTGIEKIRQQVAASGACPIDRLAVIFCVPFKTVNVPNNTHGMQCEVPGGGRCVLVNITSVAADKVTLLHEVGHGAGIGHEPDNTNFMSYGLARTKINPVQLARFDKAFFCGL